jgi:uncharacterized phage protein (TIGR01671 family)
MKREIKFRAWDKRAECMGIVNSIHFGYSLQRPYVPIDHVECRSSVSINLSVKPVNYTVFNSELKLMQFTGLKDKNGKEIYEGDIVLYGNDTDPNPVIFDNQMFCVPVGTGVHKTHLHIMGGENKWEVIGNIYENPKLLK